MGLFICWEEDGNDTEDESFHLFYIMGGMGKLDPRELIELDS